MNCYLVTRANDLSLSLGSTANESVVVAAASLSLAIGGGISSYMSCKDIARAREPVKCLPDTCTLRM